MSTVQINPSRKTPEYMPSIYCNTPAMRARDLPEIVSVELRDLFPDLPEAIYVDDNDDVSVFYTKTEEALAGIDMSDITPTTSVNLCCAEHGFVIYGGKPYTAMLKTIKRVVAERTGCRDIRLRVVMYRTPKEGQEVIDYYNLREEFDNNVEYVWAYDKAVPIETYLGTFYGLEKAYDADKFIYVYYDDPRELYCHKMYRKSFKAFTMNMARYETRSIFHSNMGDIFRNGAAGDVIPMAIYDSDFVQSKYAFSCFLRSSPAGLVGVDADRDLYALDDRIMTHTLREYALPYHLYRSISDFNMIIDGGRWSWYMAGGGIVDGAMINGYKDSFDLDDNFSAPHGNTAAPGLKTTIINQAWYGITFPLSALMPTILVGDELAGMFKYDTCNKPFFMFPGAKVAQTLPEAYAMSKEISGSDRFLVFDGSFGFVNCSRSMAEELIRLAPSIREKVNNELYPKYMKQRGLELPK